MGGQCTYIDWSFWVLGSELGNIRSHTVVHDYHDFSLYLAYMHHLYFLLYVIELVETG